MTRVAAILVLGLAACVGAARADEAAIRKAIEPKLGGVRIDAIVPTPIPGVFEIQFRTPEGMQVIYSDATGQYAIQGTIYDFQAERNLTEEKLRKLNVVKFDELPLDLAVKIKRGNGKRVLAMFSDPYCPYCQQFEKTLQQIDDVTIYVFMYPIIRPQNADHSKAVWCSPDRAKAWLDLAIQSKRPAAAATCDNPVDKVLELGRSLRVNSTPTLILSNGERIAGGLPAQDLRNLLDQVAGAAPPTAKKR
jgi:thiol:disulfide interchange protein DsbC